MVHARHRSETCALLLSLALASCTVVHGVANAPGEIVDAVSGAPPDIPSIDLEQVSSEARRFADRISAQVDVGASLFTMQDTSAEASERALMWRVGTAERAFQIAAQTRPVAALADLIALCAYEEQLHSLHWMKQWSEADRPMLEVWTSLQQQGLEVADRCLPAPQCKALRTVLVQWSQAACNPDELLRSGAPRLEELASKNASEEERNTLLGTLGLDPLDSIEPAARELARARELGERAVFMAQRMPRILAWRVEFLTLRAGQQPAMATLLQDVNRTSKAVENAVATAGALPEKLRVEGDSLIQRVSSELTVQRAGIVEDLERTSGPTQALLAQLQQTLDSATRLSQSLDTTTKAVDTFVANVSGPDPAGAPPAEPETPGKPFDPVEYTTLATQVTGTLHELNTAVANLDRTLPALTRTVDEAAARVDRSVERVWVRAVWLVLIAVAAVTAAVVFVRRFTARRQPA